MGRRPVALCFVRDAGSWRDGRRRTTMGPDRLRGATQRRSPRRTGIVQLKHVVESHGSGSGMRGESRSLPSRKPPNARVGRGETVARIDAVRLRHRSSVLPAVP